MNRNPQEVKTEKRRRSNKTESSTEHKPQNAPSRFFRIAALAFLVLITAAIAGGVLYLRTHLDDVRDRVYAELITRSGLHLEAATIELHRFRGIRLTDLEASWSPANSPVIYVSAPQATIDISLSDLLTGQITIERLHLESAVVTISLDEEEENFWSELLNKDQEPGELEVAFRVTGSNCALSVYGLRNTPAIQLSSLDFDIAHLQDARDTHARISGVFDSDLTQNFLAHMRFATAEDFDLRLETDNITEEFALKFFPEYATWISHGVIHPKLRISGQEDQRILILLEAGFENLLLNDLPVLDTPAHGTLTVLATYDVKNRLLDLNAAQADAVPAGGRLDGFISFADKVPELDLHLTMRHLPVVELVDSYFQQQLEELGTLTLTLEEPHEIQLDITGPLLEPDFMLLARIAAGNVVFVPKDKKNPQADIDFTQLRLEWLGREQNPEATFNLAGGTVQHAEANLELQHLYGHVQLTQDRLVLEGLRAEIFGDTITGTVTYNTTTKQTDVALQGVLHGLDAIPWLERVPKLRLAGSAAVRCTGNLTSDRYQLDMTVDATQTLVEYDWWFQKVSGMGANISTLNIDVIPRKSISIAGNALLDTTPLSTTIDLEWNGERWQGRHARVRTDTINVVTAGKCIRVPYAFRGRPGQRGEFEWRRLPEAPDRTTITLKGFFEEGAIYPDGSDVPIQVRNLDIEAVYANANGSKETNLYIQAEYGRTPPLTESWLKPIRPEDPELDALFPRSNMVTRFQAEVGELALLPWEGRDFRGQGFASENTIHLEHFAAAVGEGSVNGNYYVDRIENLVELNATWERVPSEYLLAHLDLPAALDGPNTGEVRYIIDRDDPNTLRGSGNFEIDNGQFSADFISRQFEQYLQGDISSLPPSMRFTRLRSEIGLEGDMIRTPNMLLISEGVTMTGGGHFYLHGDMHYDINVAVSPNTAERIPVLRDNFNIEGHRITQNDIVLGFRISGPMFNPSGQLAGLPGVGVTLVSGAGQVTSDALKVITVPGQILLDLLKIGGSIVGGTR